MQTRPILFFCTLLLALITAGLDFLALHFSLYWIFSWFDCVVHFVGGMMIAFLCASFVSAYLGKKHVWSLVALAVIGVGIAWEVFEYHIGASKGEVLFWSDTVSDLLSDIVGGLIGVYVLRRILGVRNGRHS